VPDQSDQDPAGERPGRRRLPRLGGARRPHELRRRVHDGVRRRRRRAQEREGGRRAGAPGDRLHRRRRARPRVRPAPGGQPGPQPAARAARPPGRPAGRDGRHHRVRRAPGREPPGLGGDLARSGPPARRGRPVAGDRRRLVLLPAGVSPCVVPLQHGDVRPGLLAQLSLLPRPRHVGRRGVRVPGAAADRAGVRPCAARPPVRAAARGEAQRRDERVGRPPVSLGEQSAGRRGAVSGQRPRARLRAARQPRRRAGVRPVRPGDGGPRVPGARGLGGAEGRPAAAWRSGGSSASRRSRPRSTTTRT